MKEPEPLVLFDIDYVLFDDEHYIQEKRRQIARIFGSTPEDIEQFDKAAADQTTQERGKFDIATYSRKLSNLLSSPERFTDIVAIFDKSDFYLQSLFQDTTGVLEKLIKVFRLGVFSEGDKDLQMRKLRKSGILKFFTKELIFIYPDKIREIAGLAEKCKPLAVIDDRPEVVIAWANLGISKVIRIKRGRYQAEEMLIKQRNVFEVEGLEAILPILEE